jgi:hypothetical protein
MKMIVIGTRYFSFSAINCLTEACAASSEAPLRTMIPSRSAAQAASFALPVSVIRCRRARGELLPHCCGWPIRRDDAQDGRYVFTGGPRSDKMNNNDDRYRCFR